MQNCPSKTRKEKCFMQNCLIGGGFRQKRKSINREKEKKNLQKCSQQLI